MTKSAKYKDQLKVDLLKIGINIDNDGNIEKPISITNYIYFRLVKLFPQIVDRRRKVLQLLGAFDHHEKSQVLPTQLFHNFDRKFSSLRETASRKNNLDDFEKEIITLSLKSISTVDTEMSVFETSSSMNYEPPKKISRLSNPVVPSLKPASSDLSAKLRNTQKKLSYYKNSAKRLRETLKDKGTFDFLEDYDELCIMCEDQSKVILSLKEKVAKLEQDLRERDVIIDELNERWKYFENKSVIDLKDKGKFTVSAQACFGQLITECSVAHDKVPKVIKAISNLLNVEVVSLPSRWTVDRSLHFVNGLNSEQIVKVLSGCSNKAVMSDETKKFTKIIDAFGAAGVNDDTGESFFIFIGGSRVPDKGAFRMFKELEDMLGMIAKLCKISKEDFWNDFVLSTKTLVSDEASTQKLLVKIYTTYKKKIISKLSGLDEETRAKLEKINTFFCRLHMITNTTQHFLAVLLEQEKEITGNNDAQSSSVEMIIKKFAKKFSKRSAAFHSSGCDWETYGHDKKLKNYKVDSFCGHRFQILYKIAVQIIYNKNHLIDFLAKYGGDDEVMIELQAALQNKMIVLHLSLLALFDVLVFSPFMRFSENCNSILETANIAIPLINFLQQLIDEPMTLFLGESPFDSFPVSFPKDKKGIEYENAIKSMPPILGASEITPLIAARLKSYFEIKLQPFITGDYSFPDATMEKETAGAPSTNREIESFFGVVDYLINTSPNMTTYNVNIKAVAIKNKVYEYVASLSEKEREELYQRVYGTMKLSAELAAEKKVEIQRELYEKMEQKALKLAKENSEKQRKKHKLASELEICGFWRTVEALDNAIKDKRAKDIKCWVKSNIQYRKVVWSPKFQPKWLMQFSHKVDGHNHTFTCDELIANLKQLINTDPVRMLEEDEE